MSEHTDRTGLYIMVFICLLSSCQAELDIADVKEMLEDRPKIEKTSVFPELSSGLSKLNTKAQELIIKPKTTHNLSHELTGSSPAVNTEN